MQYLDSLAEFLASYYDTLALLVVCYLTARLRSGVAFIVLIEFTVTHFCQDFIRSLELWGSLGLDYHYALGIKDTILALTLFIIAASPWLTAAYIFPAFLCWGLWSSYSLLNYSMFLDLYHAWSPLYTVAMILQIYGLSRGSDDAGKRIRRAIIPVNWDRLFQPFCNFAYTRIATNHFRITESDR